MTPFEQLQRMKESLYRDLLEVLDKHRTHIGVGLLETDVVGVIEKVKFDYLYESKREDER